MVCFVMFFRYCGEMSEIGDSRCSKDDDSVKCGCSTDLCITEEPFVVLTKPENFTYNFVTSRNSAHQITGWNQSLMMFYLGVLISCMS